jgi:hypothetical protein
MKELADFQPDIGRYIPHRFIWRWEVIGGICLTNGYRYGAEIGVSTGRFTTFLCMLLPDMRMIAVDPWVPQPDNEGKETWTQGWNHEKSYKAFKAKVEASFPSRVQIIRDFSVNAAKLVADGRLDFVFIDADHSYEACKADIEAWTPKLRRGGLLAGHDYQWPTVARAVNETGGTQFILLDNCWARFV